MPRLPRYSIPGQPQHVIQRGNNKTPIFGQVQDYLYFRQCLGAAMRRFGCELHAYALMTNHVHLLISPSDTHGISRVMQCVGRGYVRYFNDLNARTGTLWEGRFRATLIDSESYLFTCHRYIEENPVRAGISRALHEYPWTSYAFNALGAEDRLVTPHHLYLTLGQSAPTRQRAYAAMFTQALPEQQLATIREATNHAWALGSEFFRQEVSRRDRRAAPLREYQQGILSAHTSFCSPILAP